MLLEKLEALIGTVPPGAEDIVYIVALLFLLYLVDSVFSFLKIALRGLK